MRGCPEALSFLDLRIRFGWAHLSWKVFLLTSVYLKWCIFAALLLAVLCLIL